MAKPLRLCLAASGGGHVRQLLDLEPVWSRHAYFFVTEDTALGNSIAQKHETHYVPHVALGQARLGAPVHMIRQGFRNLFTAFRIIWRERPDVVITTGAGTVFFAMFWARLFGARVYLVDSFARFHKPSVFARVGGLFAHVRIAQSQESASHWPGALVFDPFRTLNGPRPAKEPLLFATVGATLPFDRLVNLVADAKARGLIPEQVLIQCGDGGVKPPGIETVDTMSFDTMTSTLERAEIVVCHGGTGSLITALRAGCRIIAVPRLFSAKEIYDNHQEEITQSFKDRGLVSIANTSEEFAQALQEVRTRPPVSATTDPAALIAYLDKELDALSG
jgi:UDP-N-acetylglucosamine--N-acetylmuramyl-(pentapeptide) pyrophosphoryl-undecaprenol N-acetylglucosamine transferase